MRVYSRWCRLTVAVHDSIVVSARESERDLRTPSRVWAGGSQEASWNLQSGVRAGAYHVVLDGIVIHPVDVQFDLLARIFNLDQ
jgi:hypothetical protein